MGLYWAVERQTAQHMSMLAEDADCLAIRTSLFCCGNSPVNLVINRSEGSVGDTGSDISTESLLALAGGVLDVIFVAHIRVLCWANRHNLISQRFKNEVLRNVLWVQTHLRSPGEECSAASDSPGQQLSSWDYALSPDKFVEKCN